ncbi:hypothetical protein ABZ260_28720, partial [Streptosporangium sp. NPDC006013]|uniref:hypothetical protein n=1 Tax=Streptosporangium sp. NPDC006013 TaxID=3155596 RepID=UPI0033A8FFE5
MRSPSSRCPSDPSVRRPPSRLGKKDRHSLGGNDELVEARSGIMFTLVVVGGVALIAAPWLAA